MNRRALLGSALAGLAAAVGLKVLPLEELATRAYLGSMAEYQKSQRAYRISLLKDELARLEAAA